MGYQLGIDLGTTYTAAAVHRDGRVEVVGLGDRAAAIPSVVFIREAGDVLTGEPANRRGLEEPDRVAREFKRRVGDPTPLYVGGSPWAPHLLMARMLRSVIDRVAEREGAYPDAIAVTHPANWGTYKVDLLRQAVRHGGFGEYPIVYLTEPQAAAMHYATQQRIAPGSVVAVYDLGGGTFDAAVLRRQPDGGFEIVGQPEGIEHLGGIDFDAAVLRHVDHVLDGAVSGLDPDDPESVSAVARLRAECVEAKEALSSDVDVAVPVSLPTMRHSVRLTRSEFEAMVRPAVQETITALRRALHSARVAPEQIEAVLLVGGSSRIPLVGQMVSNELGRPVAVDAHPKHAIAQGAAIAAAQLAGEGTADTVTMVETAEPETPAAAAGVVTGPTPAVVAAGPAASAAPAEAPSAPPPWQPPPVPSWQQPAAPSRGRKKALIGSGVAAVLVVGAIAVFAASRDGDETAATVTATIDDTTGLPGIRDEGDAWLVPMQTAGLGTSGLIKIDRQDGRTAEVQDWINSSDDQPVVTDDAVWLAATNDEGLLLDRFDRDDGTFVGSTPLETEAEYQLPRAFRGRDGIWVAAASADRETSAFFKVDEQTADVTASLEIDGAINTNRVAIQGDRLFVTASDPQGGVRLVQVSGEATRTDAVLPGIGAPDALAVVGDDVWTLRKSEGVINPVDADDLTLGEPIALPEQNAFGLDVAMLVTNEVVTIAGTGSDDNRVKLFQVDRETNEIETVIPEEIPPASSVAFAVGPDDDVWVYAQGDAGDGEELAPATAARIDDGDVTVAELPPSESSFPGIEVFDDVVVINEVTNLGPLASPRAYLVDRERVELVDTVATDVYPTLPTFADGRLFVTDLATDQVHVIEDDEIVGVVDIERALWPATPVGSELWTLTDDGGLSVFDADDPEDSHEVFAPESVVSPLLVDGDQVWMGRGSRFSELDAANHDVARSVESEGGDVFFIDQPALIDREMLAFGALWVDGGDGTRRIDTVSGAAAEAVIPGFVVDYTPGNSEMWVTNDAGQVFKLDPATGAQLVAGSAGEGIGQIIVAGEEVWYVDYDGNALRKINPEFASGNITVEFESEPSDVLFAAGSLWVTVEESNEVVRVDPVNGEIVETISDVGRRPAYVVGDDEQIWVALQGERTVVRIDPETNEVAERVDLER